MFLVFEGVDGAGKSTQIERFCDSLAAAGHELMRCREPGSTALGERLRELLLNHGETPIGMRAEMLIYMAARAQLVEEVIAPALAAGKTVVSDRFLLSSVVYQGHAGGLPIDEIRAVGAVATSGVRPDLTFLLDLHPDDAVRRAGDTPDRIESRGGPFFRKVRDGFLSEAAAEAKPAGSN